MSWIERRWQNARWLKRTAIFECGVALLALVLLALFAASGNVTAVVVLACVTVLASGLAVVFGRRGRALGRV